METPEQQGERRAAVAAQLEEVAREALAGWRESRALAERNPGGNPALLAQARGALADLRELLALDLPPAGRAAGSTGAGEPGRKEYAGIDLEAV
jgi:hypothetical protein